MTTTNDSAIRKITALRDRARHTGTPAAEAETALTMARKLCVKYGVDVAILEAKTEQTVRRDYIDGGKPQTKKYSCRFGCGMFVQHTIDELNACAEKARNAAGGNAYNAKRDPFDDLFGAAWGKPNQGPNYGASSDGREHKARATGSHAYCSHEATKSARAKCRRERGY